MKTQISKRAQAEFSIDILAPVDKIFTLACPVEELRWIDRWDFTMVYSDSGKNEMGCIFIEEMSAQHLVGPQFNEKTFWITTRYDPDAHVISFILARSTTLSHLEVTMNELPDGGTRVTWDMTMTSIKEEVNAVFDNVMVDRMTLMLSFLGQSLKQYCETGTKLVVAV